MTGKKKKLKDLARAGILSLCIYTSLTLVGDSPVHLVGYKTTPEDIKIMLDCVEEQTSLDTEQNENMILFYHVLENNNLSEKEKNLIYELSEMIKENPYIDVNLSCRALRNLRIVYKERPEEYSNTVVAIYSSEDNEISVFTSREDVPREILIHEIIHCIFNNIRTYNLPDYLVEGTKELLTNEYCSEKPFVEQETYPFETNMSKLLCEMVGSDTVLKTYTDGNIDNIKECLQESMGQEETDVFMGKLSALFSKFKKNRKVSTTDIKFILDYTDKYFTEKFKETNDQDVLARYIYYKDIIKLMTYESPYEKYIEYVIEKGTYSTVFFSKDLKEKYPKPERINIDGSRYMGQEYQYIYKPQNT